MTLGNQPLGGAARVELVDDEWGGSGWLRVDMTVIQRCYGRL